MTKYVTNYILKEANIYINIGDLNRYEESISYFDVESYSLHPHLGKKDLGCFFSDSPALRSRILHPLRPLRVSWFFQRRGAGDDSRRFLVDAMGAMMVDDGALARSRPQARFRLRQGQHRRWGGSLAAPSRGQRPGLVPTGGIAEDGTELVPEPSCSSWSTCTSSGRASPSLRTNPSSGLSSTSSTGSRPRSSVP